MIPTEEMLRETYQQVGGNAPDASPVLARIMNEARTRRRRREIGGAIAAVVAITAVVVPLTVWPRHAGGPAHPKSFVSTKNSVPTHGSANPGTAVSIGFTPTWLPAGFVETERWYDPGGYQTDNGVAGPSASRIFGTGSGLIMVTDGALRDDNTWQSGETVVVGGQHGAVSANKSDIAADLQVPWHSGRLLDVRVTGAHDVGVSDARAIAIRVAQSLRSAPAVSLDVPLTCTDSLCSRHYVDVSGTPDKWQAAVGGPDATAALTYSPYSPPKGVGIQHLTVNGHPALVWAAGLRHSNTLTVTLGSGRSLQIFSDARRPLSREEAVRVAKSVHLAGHWNYDWLGTRPY